MEQTEIQSAVIWEYPLALVGTQTLQMPQGAALLTVQLQASQLTLWALANPTAPLVGRTFAVVGTGEEGDAAVMTRANYIGTVSEDRLVWHVFDRGEG
jgi:hypothetical protein